MREQLRKNSGPFLSQGGSPPKLCDFCTVFALFLMFWQKIDHVTTTPWENAHVFFEPKEVFLGFGDDFPFHLDDFWFGSVFVFGGVTNNPSNP